MRSRLGNSSEEKDLSLRRRFDLKLNIKESSHSVEKNRQALCWDIHTHIYLTYVYTQEYNLPNTAGCSEFFFLPQPSLSSAPHFRHDKYVQKMWIDCKEFKVTICNLWRKAE